MTYLSVHLIHVLLGRGPRRERAHVERVVAQYGSHVGRGGLRGHEGGRVLAERERGRLAGHWDGHLGLALPPQRAALSHRAQRERVREPQRVHAATNNHNDGYNLLVYDNSSTI